MDGMNMYCTIMGYIETVKRRGLNIYKSIAALFEGRGCEKSLIKKRTLSGIIPGSVLLCLV